MSDTTQANTSPRSVKEILFRQVDKLGVAGVLAVLLILFSQADVRRQEAEVRRQAEQQRLDQVRWEQLFAQYREDAQAYRQTIEVCCHDRLIRLEEAEANRIRRGTR